MTHLTYICLIILCVLFFQQRIDVIYDRARDNGVLINHPVTGKLMWKDEIVILVPSQTRESNLRASK